MYFRRSVRAFLTAHGFLAMKCILAFLTTFLLMSVAQGQAVDLPVEQYDRMKAAGTLPAEFNLLYPTLPPPRVQPASSRDRAGGDCNCWIEPDSTYSLAMEPNDDGSSAEITLPFTFDLYGDQYTTCFVNNNGNVSFLLPHPQYVTFGFPTPSYRMVAAFWADVDTRAAGTVKYKLTPNALYVNWTGVGYFNEQTDKLNTFQLIISDGTNADVGIGSTVAFCYKEMEWTTGSASCSSGPYTCSNAAGSYSCDGGAELGFCGTPATVGANRGNAVDFVQFGRFNMPGMTYDGPFGFPDEVGWLSYKNFVFSTAVTSSNIAPVASGNSLCDTVRVCAGEPVSLNVDFLSPEQGQTTTAAYAISPPLTAPVSVVSSGPGNTTNLQLQFTPAVTDTGFYVITYTATDDGSPALSSTVSVVLHVAEVPVIPPVISGDTVACRGGSVQLTASGDYPFYEWSNGRTGPSITAAPGTYTVAAGPLSCGLLSESFVVHEAPTPAPVIDGVLFNCGGEPTVLATTEPYDGYVWSDGGTGPTIRVGTGSYSVTVTNEWGCSRTSAPVNVRIATVPTAFFTGNPQGEVFPGATVSYTDRSDGNGATITSWSWDAGVLGGGSGTTFTHTFDTPGMHPIALTVTTSEGCTHTYTYVQLVLPEEIILPNVFTPNDDGHNDALVFEGVQFYPNTSLQVMNRWGQEVYASTNYANTWRPAKDIPDGTYYYILKLFTGKEYAGHVTLLR